MAIIRSFGINIPDTTIARIRQRVSDYPWQDMPALDSWEYGTSHCYLREICDY